MKTKEEILLEKTGRTRFNEFGSYGEDYIAAMQTYADQETTELKEKYEGLDNAATKWRLERDNLLIENKSLRSEIASLRSRLDECKRQKLTGSRI